MKVFLIMLIGLGLTSAQTLTRGEGNYQLPSSFKLSALLDDYAKTTGRNLSLPENFKDQRFYVYGKKTLEIGELTNYVSSVLHEAGYTMLEKEALNTVQIEQARDVRFAAIPVMRYPEAPPENFNYYRYIYPLRHINGSAIARNLRPIVSRYGRVIDARDEVLIISETGRNLKAILEVLKRIDTESFAKNQAAAARINERAKEKVVEKVGWKTLLKDQHILFIAVFSLIFGIIGFSARGYMIKKIEGGW